MANRPKVVIIGAGFGGLWAAKALANKPVDVTVIDRKNHHTFQPLLYQVATAVLSPGEIASPIRRILSKSKNTEVILGEVVEIDRNTRTVTLESGAVVSFDYLIVAAGARHSYFGHDEWDGLAPGLKTVEDAIEIRRRILLTFELAERRTYLTGERKDINFVVVGGGPTGVELAGAIADIARQALAKDFMAIDTTRSHVLLFEGSDRVLGTFPPDLSASAKRQLEDLGVEVHLNSLVTDIQPRKVRVGADWVDCDVVLWATGVAASGLGRQLGETDRAGRVLVEPDLSVPDNRNIFVIGDMASLKQKNGEPVPGLAPAANQMGDFAAAAILGDLKGKPRGEFEYFDKGTLATIGRRRAIAYIHGWKFSGFIAWLMWTFLHVLLLIGFRNRFAVMFDWGWAYLTRERSARLITGDAEELQGALSFIAGTQAAEIAKKVAGGKATTAAGKT